MTKRLLQVSVSFWVGMNEEEMGWGKSLHKVCFGILIFVPRSRTCPDVSRLVDVMDSSGRYPRL